MALTKCPECGKDVSSQASGCPHCGFPLVKPAREPPPIRPQAISPKAAKKGGLGCVGIIVIGVVISIIASILPGDPPKEIRAAILAEMAHQHFPVASIKYEDYPTVQPLGQWGAYDYVIRFEAKLTDGRTAKGYANYINNTDDPVVKVVELEGVEVEKVENPVK
jgi:DNA-directed RNA polymerase subunit RPC12/RpoP